MFLHIFAEEGQVGELQFAGNLFDALLRVLHQVLYVLQHILVDEVGGALPPCQAADGGEVFGRDVQPVGVVGHRARLGVGRANQVDETPEQRLAGSEGAGHVSGHPAYGSPHVVEESQHQCIHHLLLRGRGAFGLGAKQVVVLAENPLFFLLSLLCGVIVSTILFRIGRKPLNIES